MNFVSVNDQLINVAQICRGCPTPTLQRAYVRALREWAQQTQWLRLNLPGALEMNVQQYALGNDPQLDICGIYAMQGIQTPTSSSGSPPPGPQFWTIMPSNSGQWNPNVQPSMPIAFQYIPEAQFSVFPIPQQDYGCTITLIVQPKEGAINIPSSPLIKYSNEIEAGALSYLMQIDGQPWTKDARAAAIKQMAYARQFQSGISNGKADAQRNYNVGSIRATPRAFVAPGAGSQYTY